MSKEKLNRFEIQGTVSRVDHFEMKAGKDIVTLILDVPDDKYPQLVPIKVFGRLAGESGDWHPGAEVLVKGHLGGRDWNGRVFGDIVGESVEVVAGSAKRAEPAQSELPPPPDDSDIPF